MKKFIKIGVASNILGVSVQTLRRWEKQKILISVRRKSGSTRYYDIDDVLGMQNSENDLTICYARVSTYDQKKI
jgi:predicted site-specific integrase-resolvase